MGEWKFDLALGKLRTIGPLEFSRTKSGSSDNLDGTGTAAMTACHLIVELRDSTRELNITVLAVHVVGSRPRVITKPNAVVLHAARVLFDDFNAVKNLACGLLHFTELTHEVPKLGLGRDWVRSEDDHTVRLRVWVFVGASLAADHLILTHLSRRSHVVCEKTKEIQTL